MNANLIAALAPADLAADVEAFASTGHDLRCELGEGGAYFGRTLRDGGGIPCHCAARADGRRKAAIRSARGPVAARPVAPVRPAACGVCGTVHAGVC